MKITFIGAAKTVTGSQHLIETNGTKFLLDCGMYQGKRKEAFEMNRKMDMLNPKEIDFVILSHAHIDHSGNLPSLVKLGFEGRIYTTFATADLASLMLLDSAHIQMRDVEYVNKKRKRQGQKLFEPLYTHEHVVETMGYFVGVNYHRRKQITPDIELTFYDAGHILGSAITYLTIKENGRTIRLGFTGDLGRPNLPILRDPEKIPPVDVYITESTYGDRLHDDYNLTEKKMADVITRAVEKKSKIVVPAFSVGRTQELVYLLHNIFDNDLAPRLPIYVDSPLSSNATEVFRMHPECFDLETSLYLIDNQDPFGFNQLRYIRDVEYSKSLNEKEGPMMIISASGMAEAGRVLHHLANTIENPNNMVLIVGYAPEHTLARRIRENDPEVKIFGDHYKLNAEVVVFNSLSAHADANELTAYAETLDKEALKDIFLVHGEYEQQSVFAKRLQDIGFDNVHIPNRGNSFTL